MPGTRGVIITGVMFTERRQCVRHSCKLFRNNTCWMPHKPLANSRLSLGLQMRHLWPASESNELTVSQQVTQMTWLLSPRSGSQHCLPLGSRQDAGRERVRCGTAGVVGTAAGWRGQAVTRRTQFQIQRTQPQYDQFSKTRWNLRALWNPNL